MGRDRGRSAPGRLFEDTSDRGHTKVYVRASQDLGHRSTCPLDRAEATWVPEKSRDADCGKIA